MSEGKQMFETLTEKQQEELRQTEERLKKVLNERRASKKDLKGQRLSEKALGSLTFRWETVRCGKKNCTKCPHGPYWYVYWKDNGRTRSRYVGRDLPLRAKKVNEAKQQARLDRKSDGAQ